MLVTVLVYEQENSKNSIAKARPSHPESSNSIHSTSLNSSFKMTANSRSYRSPKTPYLSNGILGKSSTAAEESNKQSKRDVDLQLKVDDIRLSPSLPLSSEKPASKPTSAKLAGRNFGSVEETAELRASSKQTTLVMKKTDATPKGEAKDSSQSLIESSINKRSTPSTTTGSKVDSKLSIRLMMSPPLVVFGGQNAVRLDPLLTRKSTAASGSLL
jgi:hypothetical protein